MVITRGLAEMTRLGVALGGDPRTFAGLTGLGDLMATCLSPLSRNRRFGEAKVMDVHGDRRRCGGQEYNGRPVLPGVSLPH